MHFKKEQKDSRKILLTSSVAQKSYPKQGIPSGASVPAWALLSPKL
jgi:hypothetical protein